MVCDILEVSVPWTFRYQIIHIGCLFVESLTTISTCSDIGLFRFFFLPEYIFCNLYIPRTVFYLGFQIHWHDFMFIISDESYGSRLYFFWLSWCFYLFLLLSFWIKFEKKFTVLLVFKSFPAFCLLKISREWSLLLIFWRIFYFINFCLLTHFSILAFILLLRIPQVLICSAFIIHSSSRKNVILIPLNPQII